MLTCPYLLTVRSQGLSLVGGAVGGGAVGGVNHGDMDAAVATHGDDSASAMHKVISLDQRLKELSEKGTADVEQYKASVETLEAVATTGKPLD